LAFPTGDEREQLPPSEPDESETYGCDARSVIDHCSVVPPWEQSCPRCPNRRAQQQQTAHRGPEGRFSWECPCHTINDGDIDRRQESRNRKAAAGLRQRRLVTQTHTRWRRSS